MRFPDFVIGGAPKCGTTSLFAWLADHPDVCGASVKEPFFLMDRGNPLLRADCNVHDHGISAYGRFFEHCQGEKIALEATTHYLYQSTALEHLAALPTRPRLLFLLRKPSERVYSSFVYSRAKGRVRPDISFAQYVKQALEGVGEHELEGVSGPSAYVLARDLEYSRYVDHLPRWREALGEDRLKIMLFEDVRADPYPIIEDICAWIGIDPAYYRGYDFVTRNRTVAVRSPWLARLARGAASLIPDGQLRSGAKRLYQALQSKDGRPQRTPTDEAAIAELDAYFRPYNRRLGEEFGLDLSAWGLLLTA